MTDELLHAVRDLPSSTPFLHVPAQHGANSMLKRMRRHYTVEEYKELVDRIYATIPGATITSDFIVGFCGETEEEFQQTVDLVRYAKFKNSFIFKYSERPGNEAARMMKDDIPEEVKKQRNNELLAVQNEISLEGSRSFIGKTVEILVEGPSKRETKSAAAEDALYEEAAPVEATFDTTGVVAPIPEKTLTSVEETLAGSAPSAFGQDDVQMTGRTACDRIVVFDGTRDLAGGFHKIKITDATPFTLVGEFVE